MSKKPTYEELEQRVKELEKEILEHNQVEHELLFKGNIISSSSSIIATCDLDGKMNYGNPSFLKTWGFEDAKEFLGRHFSEFWVVKERLDEIMQALRSEGKWFGEVKAKRKDGTLFDVQISAATVYDAEGRPVAFTSTSIDITDRKLMEEALRESETKHKTLVNNIPGMVYRAYPDWSAEIISGSEAICDYTEKELNSKEENWVSIIHHDDKERVLKAGSELPQAQKDMVQIYRIKTKGGDIRWVEDRKTSIFSEKGKFIGIDGIVFNITDRKSAEEALRKSEERFRAIFEKTAVGVLIVDSKTRRYIRVNPAFQGISGYSIEELSSMSPTDITHPEDWPSEERLLGELHSQKLDQYQIEKRYVRKDGGIFWGRVTVSIVLDGSGHPEYTVSIVEDITDRQQAEEALRESEEKYRTVLEASTDPIVVYDIEGKVMYFNPAFRRVFGWTLEERLGKKMDVFVPDEDWPETRKMIDKVLSGESFSGFETRRYTKVGNIIHVNMSASIYKDQDGNPIGSVINLRDISEQKRLETQLQQAQKMEAMGTLAGGIAHDFNNLLMGIQGRASLMLMDTDSPHSHSEHLKGIEDYVKSATELTKQLLGFARGGKYEVKPTNLNDLITNQNQMFGRTRKEINIQEKFEKDLWATDVDQGQIEQVLLNLYVNSWQAMPGGGGLYIQTENIEIDESFNRPYHVDPGKYVKISVTDTGVGMDKATRQRIFDPFFTTKEMGRGTGLGLASAYGIIKNHGGFIDVYSEKGEGTTFNIYLPASEKEVVKEKELHEELFRGAGTLLLVDDEDMIVDVGCGIIEKLGYNVLTAKSGKEAIEIYKKNHDKIDMVILDMIMPEMGGGETYDKLKEIYPGIKVLLSSGYSIDGEATKILERGCNGFIQKPFYMTDLSKKIREILDKE